MKFLLQFNQVRENFRLAELDAVAKLHGIQYEVSNYRLDSPFCWIELSTVDDVAKLCKRCFLVKAFFKIWRHAATLGDVVNQLGLMTPDEYGACIQSNESYKISIETYAKKTTTDRKEEIFKRLETIPFESTVCLDNPAHTVVFIDEYRIKEGLLSKKGNRSQGKGKQELVCCYVGLLVQRADARSLVYNFTLSNRKYIGLTSMDPELAFLTANMGSASKNKIIYDPFCGTGSLLIHSAFFGAYVIGADIDYKVVRGTNNLKMIDSFRQYNLESRLLDVMISDQYHHPFVNASGTNACMLKFDAIICDPPYGIREDCRKIGYSRAQKEVVEVSKKRKMDIDSKTGHHISQKTQYPLSELYHDLVYFAAHHLEINGRLVFWLPSFRDDYNEDMLPSHPSLKILYNCEDVISFKWSRRLITMVKTMEPHPTSPRDPVPINRVLYYDKFRDNVILHPKSTHKLIN